MCVIMATIVFKCSSVQCHDFLLSFYQGHFFTGWVAMDGLTHTSIDIL